MERSCASSGGGARPEEASLTAPCVCHSEGHTQVRQHEETLTYFVRCRLLNFRKSVFVSLTSPRLWLALASSSGPKLRMEPPRDSATKGAIGKASRFELFLCAPLGDVRLRSNVDLLRPSLQKWRAMPLGCRQLPPAWPLRAPRHGAGGPTLPPLAEGRVRGADQERLL